MVVLHHLRCMSSVWSATNFHGYCQLQKVLSRSIATQVDSFKYSDLVINLAKPAERRPKPDESSLVFGAHFSDHMLEIEWTKSHGWGKPCICPLHDLPLHPAAKVLHYAQELFEGMKAFRSNDNKILLFRPDLNMERMSRTAERTSLPYYDRNELLKCLKKLVSIDKDWVPKHEFSSLYIRPTFIGTEPTLGVASANTALLYVITGPVGPYFKTGVATPVSLLADPKYVRAWPGGVGDKKMGSNYGPSIYVQKEAEKKGIQQILWLYGDDHLLTEVGTMNIFVYLTNEKGETELVTPPLDGTILPGVVRQSLLDLAREWNEFKVSERPITMKEVILAKKENRLHEIFGAGTACVVCPVGSITYLEQKIDMPPMDSQKSLTLRFLNSLLNIQYGKTQSKWSVPVD